jgi:hypothetical protein
MSVALLISRSHPGQSQPDRHLVPVSTEERYWKFWQPVIEKEGYLWLLGMGVGIDIDAENLPEVLAELHKLQVALPNYYAPSSEQYQRMMERLTAVLAALEAVDATQLVPGRLDLFLG